MNGESPMTDPREALFALVDATLRPFQVDPERGPSDAVGAIADAILAAGWTPRGEGMTIQISGSRAGKTQALAEQVAEAVMERGGSANLTTLPSVEDVARACGDPGSVTPRREGESVPRWSARAVLALLQGRSEAEVYREGYDRGLRDAASVSRSEAEVRREAAEKAWDEGLMAERTALGASEAFGFVIAPEPNPYRKKEATDD